jgi:hypothetical protein
MVKNSSSNKPSEYKPLRPGEIKILKALQTEPRNFKALKEITGLQQNVLSTYLKRLQKIKVVTKDVDSRKYQRREVSVEILFINDIADFFNQKVKEFTNLGKEQAQVAYLPLWTAFTEYPKMKEYIESLNMKSEVCLKLSQISEIIESFWEPHILKTEYTPKDRKLIKTYKHMLLQYVKKFKVIEETESKQNTYDMLRETARFELEERFPNCEISERMVLIETAKKYRKFAKLIEDTDNVFFQPQNFEEISEILERMKMTGEYRDDFTEEEQIDLDAILAFIKNPANKKISDSFNQKLRNYPRKLVLFYVSGFHGYIEQINKIKKMIERTEKLMNKRNSSRSEAS